MPEIILKIKAELTDSDRILLRRFCEKCERLFQTKMLTDGTGISGSINWTQRSGLSFSSTLPGEPEMVEFLAAYRFFYLQKEPTHFSKILDLMRRYAQDDAARNGINILSDRWHDSLFERALEPSIDGERVTSAQLLDLWFNAHYFHSDNRKEPRLARINGVFTTDFSKYMLLDSTFECVKLLGTLYKPIKSLIQE